MTNIAGDFRAIRDLPLPRMTKRYYSGLDEVLRLRGALRANRLTALTEPTVPERFPHHYKSVKIQHALTLSEDSGIRLFYTDRSQSGVNWQVKAIKSRDFTCTGF